MANDKAPADVNARLDAIEARLADVDKLVEEKISEFVKQFVETMKARLAE